MNKKLYIVGKYIEKAPWEFVGVFDNECAAENACISDCHFVGPAILNETISKNAIKWNGLHYHNSIRV